MQLEEVSIDNTELGNPDSALWAKTLARKVCAYATPVAMQPSKYIQGKWRDGEFGQTAELGVQALHNGDEIAFRLEWQADIKTTVTADNDEFPDGVALMFPFNEDAPLMTMGSDKQPVNVWHWKADQPKVVRSNVIFGLGTSEVVEQGIVTASEAYRAGRWQVVLRRKMNYFSSQYPSVQFVSGGILKVAFAVWAGSNRERGGLKSFSSHWLEYEL
ncbi:MAG: hypothetical protein IPJ33_06975 [Gammaproteobacteria bacterium]|nr:hypothetical protein [Gammaproteobacteria bacterium]